MRLGFPCQNLGGDDFPSPVARSDRRVVFRTIQHLFSLASYYPWIPF